MAPIAVSSTTVAVGVGKFRAVLMVGNSYRISISRQRRNKTYGTKDELRVHNDPLGMTDVEPNIERRGDVGTSLANQSLFFACAKVNPVFFYPCYLNLNDAGAQAAARAGAPAPRPPRGLPKDAAPKAPAVAAVPVDY